MIDDIVRNYRTATGRGVATLQICGDSPFTRALAKRCDGWEIPCAFVEDTDPGYPVVIDREIKPGAHAGDDIDDREWTACSEGIIAMLCRINVGGMFAVVIGRGKAVRGVAEWLEKHGATVCVCHSKTEFAIMQGVVTIADIVVNAANVRFIYPKRNAFVVDVAGTLGNRANYGKSDVGKLTTAILAYRASHWEG